jgi:hypothetical protein
MKDDLDKQIEEFQKKYDEAVLKKRRRKGVEGLLEEAPQKVIVPTPEDLKQVIILFLKKLDKDLSHRTNFYRTSDFHDNLYNFRINPPDPKNTTGSASDWISAHPLSQENAAAFQFQGTLYYRGSKRLGRDIYESSEDLKYVSRFFFSKEELPNEETAALHEKHWTSRGKKGSSGYDFNSYDAKDNSHLNCFNRLENWFRLDDLDFVSKFYPELRVVMWFTQTIDSSAGKRPGV